MSGRSILARTLAGTAVVAVAGALAVAAFPWGWLRSPAERLLSAELARPVTIAAADRIDGFGLSPTVRLSGIHIPQPGWAGNGDLARIDDLTVRFPVLPLLTGRFLPGAVTIDGLHLALRRNAAGRWNTDDGRPRAQEEQDAAIPRIRHLRIRNSDIDLVDARRRLDLRTTITADAGTLRLAGQGRLAGAPIRLTATGRGLSDLDPAGRYPFALQIRSPQVTLSARGTMDRPLDLARFDARVTSRGDDLRSLDALVQAGLPETQDYRLSARVRRDPDRWSFTDLRGTLGRSDLAGTLLVTKQDGRTRLDAALRAARFDFDDLSSDAARARSAARDRAIGRRILPGTRIRLDKLGHVDGRLRFTADRLLMPPGSRFRSLDATLVLDRRRLTIRPLRVGLTHGTLAGSMVVDHRGADPALSMRLAMRGARIEDVLTSVAEASGPLDGRITLDGRGSTMRQAIAASSGTIGLVATEGRVARTLATLAAGDLLRGAGLVIGKDGGSVPIRCLVGHFVVRRGRLTPSPLLIDTPIMRADGQGTVDLATERLSLVFHGRSKQPDLIQSAAPVRISGTLARPRLDVTPPDPPGRKRGLFAKVGAFLKTIRTRGDAGRAMPAPDAACGRLERLALR